MATDCRSDGYVANAKERDETRCSNALDETPINSSYKRTRKKVKEGTTLRAAHLLYVVDDKVVNLGSGNSRLSG